MIINFKILKNIKIVFKFRGDKTDWSNGPARQPVLKGTSCIEDFNPSICSGPSHPTRQLDMSNIYFKCINI